MTMRVALLLTGLAAAAAGVASLLPIWVHTVRVIVGYGSARVVWSADAWSGFFAPWLPLGAALAGVAGLLAIAGGLRGSAVLRLAAAVAAIAAATALVGVLVTGSSTVTPTNATTWTGRPTAAVPLAAAVSAALAVVCAGPTLAPRRHLAAPLTALLAATVLAACATPQGPTPSPAPSTASAPDWRTDPNEPYPFRTPIPDLAPTELDGEYTRPPTDTYTGERAACRRCPPYPPDRGESILRLDRGRYEMVHVEPAYRSYGHFTWDGEVLTLLNDPECGTEIGIYALERDGAQLRFEVLDDPCAFGQRTRDLTDRTWTPVEIARGESCQPPNTEAAVSGHWPVPSGC